MFPANCSVDMSQNYRNRNLIQQEHFKSGLREKRVAIGLLSVAVVDGVVVPHISVRRLWSGVATSCFAVQSGNLFRSFLSTKWIRSHDKRYFRARSG